MSILNRILKESKIKGIDTPSEGAGLYDEGIQNRIEAPDVNISSMPTQNVPTTTGQDDDDNMFGFVNEAVFGLPDELQDTTPSALGYSEDQAFVQSFQQRTNPLDFMELPQEASEQAKSAAYNSDINLKDYTVFGEGLRSFSSGVGQLISGFGDTLDWAKDLVISSPDGQAAQKQPTNADALNHYMDVDIFSSFTNGLRYIGEELESWDDKIDMSTLDGQFFELDENGKVDVKYSQLLNPKFWYTKIPQQIPNLLSFMIPGFAGAKALKYASNLSRFGKANIMSTPSLTNALRFFGNKGVGNSSKIASKGRNMIKGEDVAQWFGGAMGGNFSEGAILAGESYRQVLEKGGTRDQAAMAGWGVIKDNAKWILADGLQYSILTKGVGGIGRGLKMNSGVNFKTGLADFMIGSGLALSQGKIEEFQEVYQDWRVRKRAAEVRGEEWDMSYWDYYHSAEVAETRVVSFGMGFGGAAGGVIINGINDVATRNEQLDEKIIRTGLSNDFDSNLMFVRAKEKIKREGFSINEYTEEEKAVIEKEEHIENFLSGVVANGEIASGKERISALVQKGENNGGISKEDGDVYSAKLDEIQESFQPYNNIGLRRLVPKARTELARIAYYMSQTKSDMANDNEYYDTQIENVNALLKEKSITKNVAKQQIEAIQSEKKNSNIRLQATIDGYSKSIEDLFTDSFNIVNEEEAALNKKHEEMKIEKAAKEEAEKPTEVNVEGAPKGEKKLGKVVSTKGSASNLVQKKDVYTTKNDAGESITVEVKNKADGSRELRILTKDGDLINTEKISKDNTLSDKELVQGAVNDKVSPKLKESITDVNKLYSKKQIEKHGIVREGDVNTIEQVVELEKKIESLQKKIDKVFKASATAPLNTKKLEKLQKERDSLHEQKLQAEGLTLEHSKYLTEKARKEREKAEKNSQNKKGDKNQTTLELGHLGALSKGKIAKKRAIGFEKVHRERLRKKGINLVVFDYMMSTQSGARYYGLAQGLSVFLDAGSATQETFFHELFHVYLAEYWNSNSVQDAVKLIVKSPIYQNKLETYNPQIIFENKNGGKVLLKTLIKKGSVQGYNTWKEKTKAKDKSFDNYIKTQKNKLSGEGFKMLPKAQQRFILEESLADLLGKKMDQETIDKNINKEDQPKANGIFKRIWGNIKNTWTKEEAKEILENTGNESLAENLDNAVKEVVKDFNNKEGKYEYRRGRLGFYEKMANKKNEEINKASSEQLREIIENLRQSPEGKELGALTKNSLYRVQKGKQKGMNTALFTKKLANFFQNQIPKIQVAILASPAGKDNEVYKHLFTANGNPRPALSRLLNQELKSQIVSGSGVIDGALKEFVENEENWLENYLDTRNGEGVLGQFMNNYINSEVKIQGADINIRHLRQVLYNSVWNENKGKEKLDAQSNYNTLIEDYIKRLKNNEKLNRDEEILAKFMMYMKEHYNGHKDLVGNVVSHIHHELSGYKQIKFHKINVFKGKHTVIENKPVDKSKIKKDIITSIKKRLDYQDKPTNKQDGLFVKEISRLNFLSSLVSLHNKMRDSKIEEKERLNLAKKFIYDNLLSGQKELISDYSSIEDSVVEGFIKPNEEGKIITQKLLEDTALIQFIKKDGKGVANPFNEDYSKKAAEKIKQQINDNFINFRDRKDIQDAIKNGELDKDFIDNFKSLVTWSAKNNTWETKNKTKNRIKLNSDGSIDFRNIKNTPSIYTKTIGDIASSITESIGLKEFMSQVAMPSGEKTNSMSKKHQMDVLLEQLEIMNQTEEGKKKIKILFGDNIFAKQLIDNNKMPELVQIIGSYIDKTPYDSGKTPGGIYSMLQVGLLSDAIIGNKKEYSQSVSIFSDKSIEVHIKNAPLMTYEEALKEANRLKDKVRFKNGEEYLILNEENQGKIGKDLIEHLENQPEESRPESINRLMKKGLDGKYTYAFRKHILTVVLNYAINKQQAKDFLIGPSEYFENSRDIIKRSAGSVAMGVSLGSDVRIEPLMLQDVEIDGVNKTDACCIILPEDAKKIKNKYGGIRQVGEHYKFVYNGQNLDNTKFADRVGERHPFYGKTNVFQLSDSFLEDNPNFKPVVESLRMRRNATPENVMPIAMFSSSIKVQSEKLKNSLLSVDMLAEMNESGEINTYQDDLFASEEVHGLDGSYFTLQTELDKASSTATVAKQIVSHLLSSPENSAQALKIQKMWVDAFGFKLEEKLNKLSVIKSPKEFSKNVSDIMDVDVYGTSVADLINSGSFDSGSIEVIKGILKSQFQKSLKMRGVGGITYQSTDFGVGEEVSKNEISESEGLKSYIKDNDGNITEEAEVDIDVSLGFNPGDVILLQRVPASKLGDAIIGKVRNVIHNSGTMVMVPSKLSDIIGSDYDGDAFHVVGFHKGEKLSKAKLAYNEVLSETIKFMKDKSNVKFMEEGIDFKGEVERSQEFIESIGLSTVDNNQNDLSIVGNYNMYNSNVGGKGMIGVSASFNTTHKLLSTFDVRGHDINVGINNKYISNSYKDNNNSWLSIAKLLNIFLDDANKGSASLLNLNQYTFDIASQLLARGVSFKNTMAIMVHPVTIEMAEKMRNSKEEFPKMNKALARMGFEYLDLKNKSLSIELEKDFGSQREAVAKLLYETVGHDSFRSIDGDIITFPLPTLKRTRALGKLANLDNNFPESLSEALILKQLIDGDIQIKGKKTDKSLMDWVSLHRGGVFKSAILQRNWESLKTYINELQAVDPAYSSGFREVSEVMMRELRVSKRDYIIEETTQEFKKRIKETEELIRSYRLYNTDGVYMYNAMTVIGNVFGENSKEYAEMFVKKESSLEGEIGLVLEKLESIAPNNKNFEFFNYIEVVNNKIRINNNTKQNGQAAKKAFNNLPASVQEFLLSYDLFVNNHTGFNTLLPYMGDIQKRVSNATKKQVRESVKEKEVFLKTEELKKLMEWISDRRRGVLVKPPRVDTKLIMEPGGTKVDIISEEMGQIVEGAPIKTKRKVTYKTIGKVGNKKIVDHDGKFGSEQMYMLNEEVYELEEKERKKTFKEYLSQRTVKKHLDPEKLAKNEKLMREWEYHGDDYMIKKIKKETGETVEPKGINGYVNDLSKVDKMREKLEARTSLGIMAMETAKYSVKDLLGIMKDLNTLDPVAKDNLFQKVGRVAAAKVALNSIQNQISSAEKNRLSENIIQGLKEEKERIQEGGYRADIKWGQMMLDPDISSKERAEIGVLLNELNKSQMEFQKDIIKINKKMDKPYWNLLKSKLGEKGILPWFVHYAAFKFIPYARHFYTEFLFKNIMIHEQEAEKIYKNGRHVSTKYNRVLRLKTEAEMANSIKAKTITKEEKAYWDMYREVTGMIGSHLSQKIGEDGRVVLPEAMQEKQGKQYIPHLTASNSEMLLARNLTSLYVANNYSHKLGDVNVKGMNPITKETEIKPLGMFIDDFMRSQIDKGRSEGVSVSDFRRKQQLKELVKKANDYVTKGVDARGLPVLMPEDAGTFNNYDSFNRYIHKRSKKAQFGGSIDLHKSLTTYVRKQMFDYGLDSQKGYSFNGMREHIPLIDGVRSYASFNNNPNAQKWIKDLLLDRYIYKKGRISPFGKDGKRHWSDDVFNYLHKWTMFVGLGLNFPASVGNVIIGKYNAFRQMGWTDFALGERRYFGYGIKGFNKKNADKSRFITKHFGLITDAQAQVSEGLFDGGTGDLLFAFMMGSEKYIQRAQFVGQITPEQWNSFEVVNGKIKTIEGQEKQFESLTQSADRYKSKVYEVQGKGYTDLDQRMIQSYSIFHGMLQFKRWLPTFIMDRMSSEKMLRSGEWYIGTYKATIDYFSDVVFDKNGRDIRKDLFLSGEKYNKLPQHRKDAIQRAKRGTLGMLVIAGLITMIGGFSDDDEESAIVGQLQKSFWDMNLMINIDKWEYMAKVPALSTANNLAFGVKELITGAKYQRDTKRFKKGQSKARGRLARLFPSIMRKQLDKD